MFTMQAIAAARQFILAHEVDVIQFVNFELVNSAMLPLYTPLDEQEVWNVMKERFVAQYVAVGEDERKLRVAWIEAMKIEHPLFM